MGGRDRNDLSVAGVKSRQVFLLVGVLRLPAGVWCLRVLVCPSGVPAANAHANDADANANDNANASANPNADVVRYCKCYC